MNGLVLAASVALSWALNEQHPSSEEILERCVAGFVVVPSLFLTELQNGLVMAKRRQRILTHRADKFWSDMIALDLRVQPTTTGDCEAAALLAGSDGLTVYDATYLHLAMMRGLPPVSFVAALRRAAARQGVALL